MKKSLAILLLLLIAVGCDDSTESEQPTEQPQPEQPQPDPVPADLPVIELPSITNTIGMKLKEIPAGTFTMGSPEGEDGPEGQGKTWDEVPEEIKDTFERLGIPQAEREYLAGVRRDNETQHPVTITKAFYMQTTEVTQEQWTAVMGTDPWKGKDFVKEGPNYAATWISWDDAVAYCKKLSEKEGKTYRLPTEAEWEYACRAGAKTTWSFGDDENKLGDYAWYFENAWDIDEKYAHQVELKKPNAFGLYDMHGNVFEWCYDYYGEDYYKQSPAKDPTGPTSGSFRVFRGGSWLDNSRDARSAYRGRRDAGFRFNDLGFRLVRELD
jgi:sulfatase modifying factor 1